MYARVSSCANAAKKAATLPPRKQAQELAREQTPTTATPGVNTQDASNGARDDRRCTSF